MSDVRPTSRVSRGNASFSPAAIAAFADRWIYALVHRGEGPWWSRMRAANGVLVVALLVAAASAAVWLSRPVVLEAGSVLGSGDGATVGSFAEDGDSIVSDDHSLVIFWRYPEIVMISVGRRYSFKIFTAIIGSPEPDIEHIDTIFILSVRIYSCIVPCTLG